MMAWPLPPAVLTLMIPIRFWAGMEQAYLLASFKRMTRGTAGADSVWDQQARNEPWMAPMIPLHPLCKLHRSVCLGLVAAGWLAVSAAAGPALAQGAVNENPGSSTIITQTTHEQLTFLQPTTVNQQANAYATEIIGRLAGGAALFDVTVLDAFGSAGVQAALASARTALLAAGGPVTAIAAPALLSSTSATSSVSSTIYSRDPSYVRGSTLFSAVTSTNTFGPASLMVYSTGTSSTSANPGVYSECFINGSDAAGSVVQPSTTKPTCSPFDGGTLFVLPGQLDINIDTTFIIPINTATTVTSTTTLTQVYALVGTLAAVPTSVPEPAGWTVMAAGLAALGLLALRLRGTAGAEHGGGTSMGSLNG